MLFNRLYHFIKGPNPLHPSVWDKLSSPCTFRKFEKKDFPQCLELFSLNEPGRFPKGVAEQYEKSLAGGNSYYLVTEADGRIVASGGISYYMKPDYAVLCFGLVHPRYYARGLGTALLLARLALLKPVRKPYHAFIFAVEDTFGFYRRFGFRTYNPWLDTQGNRHPSGHLLLFGSEIRQCRRLLDFHGIILPQDEDQVPFRQKTKRGTG